MNIQEFSFHIFRALSGLVKEKLQAIVYLDGTRVNELGIEDPIRVLKITLSSLEDILFFIETISNSRDKFELK